MTSSGWVDESIPALLQEYLKANELERLRPQFSSLLGFYRMMVDEKHVTRGELVGAIERLEKATAEALSAIESLGKVGVGEASIATIFHFAGISDPESLTASLEAINSQASKELARANALPRKLQGMSARDYLIKSTDEMLRHFTQSTTVQNRYELVLTMLKSEGITAHISIENYKTIISSIKSQLSSWG